MVIADSTQLEKSTGRIAIDILQGQGLAISADSYLGRLTDFYSTVLQVSLAAFVLFGFVSYLAIRWQSVRAAQDMIHEEMDSATFRQSLKDHAQDAFDLNAEPLERQIQQLGDLTSRLEVVEARMAELSSAEEPAELTPAANNARSATARTARTSTKGSGNGGTTKKD
ncbi:MAG TPA: hypothetical protein VIN06_19875 [Devosia sp.]